MCVDSCCPSHIYFLFVLYLFSQGALVEANAEVGPNSVVPPGQLVPAGEIWAGTPVAKVAGATHPGERAEAEKFLAEEHAVEFLPTNTGFWQGEK